MQSNVDVRVDIYRLSKDLSRLTPTRGSLVQSGE